MYLLAVAIHENLSISIGRIVLSITLRRLIKNDDGVSYLNISISLAAAPLSLFCLASDFNK